MTDDSTTNRSRLLKTAGRLVRNSASPHRPIWIEGADYPAQYLVRHTRSMTSRQNSLNMDEKLVLIVSIPRCLVTIRHRSLFPLLPKKLEVLDFFLPDENFLQLKLQKLWENELTEEGAELFEKDSAKNVRHSITAISSVDATRETSRLDSNNMHHSSTIALQDMMASTLKGPVISCTYNPLDSSQQTLCSMGYIPVQDHDNLFWAANDEGTHLLLLSACVMRLFDVREDSYQIVSTVQIPPDRQIHCLVLFVEQSSVCYAVLGTDDCDVWVFQNNSSSCHFNLNQKPQHHDVTGLTAWSESSDHRIIATAFIFPSPSLWVTSLTGTIKNGIAIDEQYPVQVSSDISSITSLCHIHNSPYLLGITNNNLIIWDYSSALMLQQVALQCTPSPPPTINGGLLTAKVLKAFLECEEDRVFVIVCVEPPTPPIANGCCWLLMVAMTTGSPYKDAESRQYQLGEAFKVYTYLLPGDFIGNRLTAKCVTISCNCMTAALSNDTIVVWLLSKPHPLGYFSISGTSIQSYQLVNEKLYIYSSMDSAIYLFRVHY